MSIMVYGTISIGSNEVAAQTIAPVYNQSLLPVSQGENNLPEFLNSIQGIQVFV